MVGNLAHQFLRQLGAELDVIRHGILRDMFAAVFQQFLPGFLGCRSIRREFDEGFCLGTLFNLPTIFR